jgi:hypothetical protein
MTAPPARRPAASWGEALSAAALTGLAVGSAVAALLTAYSLPAAPPGDAPSIAAAVVPAVDGTPKRCERCGVIQALRPVSDCAGRAGSYEFTVRMHDGTLLRVENAQAGRWKVGDRIQLVGGSPPLQLGLRPHAEAGCAVQPPAR